jgi:hypothetical protein
MIKRADWRKLEYPNKQGIIVEVIIAENGRKKDRLLFNDNNGFKRVKGILKKYGFGESSQAEVQEELNALKKENNWLDKKEGDMEW